MSYILDALKKSEKKRGTLQRPMGQPVIAQTNESTPHRFGLLLLIIAALVAGWWVAQWQGGDVNQMYDAQKFPAVIGKSERANVEMQGNDQAIVQSIVQGQPEVFPATSHAPIMHVEKEALQFKLVTPASPLTRTNVLKAKKNMGNIGSQSMPTINIEGHIYDESPHARMVIINGKVRKEKQNISVGLSLQEITPDGVILNYQGREFKMGVFDQ